MRVIKPKTSLISVYAIYLLEYLGNSIVLILFSQIIINNNYSFLPPQTDLDKRNFILGVLFFAFYFMRLLSAPIWGSLSDVYDKSKILKITTVSYTFFCFCTGFALYYDSLTFLILSRVGAGLVGVNMPCAMAIIPLLSSEKNIKRNIGLVTCVEGFSMIAAPLISMYLTIRPIFDLRFPFFLIAFLFVVVIITFHASVKSDPKKSLEKVPLSRMLLRLCNDLTIPLKNNTFLKFFITIFLFLNGWEMYNIFIGSFVIEKFHFTLKLESLAFLDESLAIIVGSLLTSYIFFRYLPRKALICISCIATSVFMLLCSIVNNVTISWYLIGFLVLASTVAQAAFCGYLAELTPKEIHGKVFGSLFIVYSLGFCFAALVSPGIANLDINAPFYYGSILTFLSGLYYFFKGDSSLVKQKNT